FDFKTKRLYFYAYGEGGSAPLSVFGKHRGGSGGFSIGLAFGANDPNDLSGPSLNATWPWVMLRLMLNKDMFEYKSWTVLMNKLAEYASGNSYANRSGVAVVSQSLTGSATTVSFGFRSYSLGFTFGYSSNPYTLDQIAEMLGLSNKKQEIATAASQIFDNP